MLDDCAFAARILVQLRTIQLTRGIMKTVRKAVFPAAGLGTRFLPATKAQPKEMLPLVDKPIIQYGVEEACTPDATRSSSSPAAARAPSKTTST